MSGFNTWPARPGWRSGNYQRANEVEALLDEMSTRSIVGYGNRPSNSAGFTTESPILRVDNIAIEAGRAVMVYMSSIRVFSTVANDDVGAILRYTVDGTAATTASTELCRDVAKVSGASVDRGGTISPIGLVLPAADGVLSVLLSGIRTNGTGTCNLLAPMFLLIENCGALPTDTGVDL